MSNLRSCSHRPTVYLPWRHTYSDPFLFKVMILIERSEFFPHSEHESLTGHVIGKYVLLILGLPLYFLDGAL